MVGFWMLGKQGSLSYSELGRNMSDVWDFVSDCDKTEFESSAGATTVVGDVSDSIHQQWGISMPIALTDDDVVLDMGMGLPTAAGSSFSPKKVGGSSSSGGKRSTALSLSHSHSQNLDLAPKNYNNNNDDGDVVKKVATPTVVGSSRKRASPASASASASASAGAGGGGGAASGSRSTASPCDHDTHIWTERERRKKMRTMFTTLHSLLPHLAPKTDKSTIIDEAINYIKSLQKSVQLLQHQKLERVRAPAMVFRSFELQECAEGAVTAGPSSSSTLIASMGLECSLQTWSSPNVVMSVCGEDAQIGICSVRRPGQLSTIFYTLEKHNIDVLTAHISGDSFRCMYMIHAHAQGSAEAAGEAYASVIGELVMYFSPTLYPTKP